MSQLRNQLAAARRGYHDCRYHGSLADDIGLRGRETSPHARHGFRWRWLIALAAMVAVMILLRQNYEVVQTATVPVTKIADAAQLSGQRQGIASATPATPAAQTAAADSTDVTAATVLSSPSLSFESITDWPSVSADFSSLGGFTWPELNTQASQTPTTQESSS